MRVDATLSCQYPNLNNGLLAVVVMVGVCGFLCYFARFLLLPFFTFQVFVLFRPLVFLVSLPFLIYSSLCADSSSSHHVYLCSRAIFASLLSGLWILCLCPSADLIAVLDRFSWFGPLPATAHLL